MTEVGGSLRKISLLAESIPPMDETHFKTLRELAKDGTLSQRELSRRMGLSLGRANYVVNALLKKGYIKAQRFKNSKNKIAYKYVLTRKGVSTKFAETYDFLQRKLAEYDRLTQEIEALRKETAEWGAGEAAAMRDYGDREP